MASTSLATVAEVGTLVVVVYLAARLRPRPGRGWRPRAHRPEEPSHPSRSIGPSGAVAPTEEPPVVGPGAPPPGGEQGGAPGPG